MTVKEMPLKTKCQCNHMFIEHNYTVKDVIHFGSCKNKGKRSQVLGSDVRRKKRTPNSG